MLLTLKPSTIPYALTGATYSGPVIKKVRIVFKDFSKYVNGNESIEERLTNQPNSSRSAPTPEEICVALSSLNRRLLTNWCQPQWQFERLFPLFLSLLIKYQTVLSRFSFDSIVLAALGVRSIASSSSGINHSQQSACQGPDGLQQWVSRLLISGDLGVRFRINHQLFKLFQFKELVEHFKKLPSVLFMITYSFYNQCEDLFL